MRNREKEKWDDQMETIARGWQFLPEHLQVSIVEIIGKYQPEVTKAQFPTPPRSTWSDVEILLTGRNQVRITVGAVSKKYTFQALGLEDKRRPGVARQEWHMLRTYAENPEPDAYYRLPKRAHLKVEISRFRAFLKKFFGIPGDPLKPFKSALWLPRFKIGVGFTA